MNEDKWDNLISQLASFSLGVIVTALMIAQNWMREFIWVLFGSAIMLLFWLCWKWVMGIDYMQENHPDYKGEDLFDEENKK
jgi:hypothetical protein